MAIEKISGKAGVLGLTIEQGATFRLTLTWRDEAGAAVDLRGYSARMQAREVIEAAEPALELTTENGGVVLGGLAGTIELHVSATATAALTWTSGVYDLELEDGDGNVTRLLRGPIQVSQEVTR